MNEPATDDGEYPTSTIAEAIMDSAFDGIVVADERGIIRSFNPAAQRLFGYSEAEALGQPVGLLMPEPHRSQHQRYIGRYLETGDKHVIGVGREVEAVRRDGERLPIYLVVNEFDSRLGRCFAAVLHDVSAEVEARDLRDRLTRAERLGAMAEMTAAVAHEMNRPLSVLAVYAQVARELAESGSAGSRLVCALQNIIEQTRQAGLAVERVRRLFQGGEPSFEATDVNTLVSETVELARTDTSPQGVMIEFSPGADLPTLRCDPVQIQQVLRNLFCNAIEAMAEIECRNGRTIRVSTWADGGSVHVAVRDSGPGIDAQAVDDIFEPFQSSKKDSLGIGLAISRTIVLNHGGNLHGENVVDSNGRTIGASFGFALPV
ncbi:MAG: PAS domain S-box protein [Gammaproteobacteria bacterium]|nr:PAS domain S-box protein [Gammaproteobacteria bacterium]MDE0442344.1 PAS domain S-box protein [Gammaproteobacteria bacterium]